MNADPSTAIAQVQAWLGRALPADYAAFLMTHEERIFGEQVLLYTAAMLIERNETYEVRVYCPGYLAIGDDSGGRAVMMPLDEPFGQLYLVGHGSMMVEDFEPVSQPFDEWLRSGCPVP
jgi:hypothetical protein